MASGQPGASSAERTTARASQPLKLWIGGARAEGRRYLGLDVLARSHTVGNTSTEEAATAQPQALTA